METPSKAGYLPGLALSAWGCGFVLGTQNGVGHLLTLADLGQMLRVQVLPLEVSSLMWLEGRPIWVPLSRCPHIQAGLLSAWVGGLLAKRVSAYSANSLVLVLPKCCLSHCVQSHDLEEGSEATGEKGKLVLPSLKGF